MIRSQRIEKELTKVKSQIANLQERQKELEEQKRMAERVEKIDFVEKNHISSEQLQLLIKFEKEELRRLLAEKEKVKNEEKDIHS